MECRRLPRARGVRSAGIVLNAILTAFKVNTVQQQFPSEHKIHVFFRDTIVSDACHANRVAHLNLIVDDFEGLVRTRLRGRVWQVLVRYLTRVMVVTETDF